jgi:hypothetical protein
MLMVVLGRPARSSVMKYVARASEQWSRGEKCLAAIELAFAGLPRLEDREDGFRLFLAEELLEKSFSPRGLMRELGPQTGEFGKDCHPEQPRVDAGNGRESGRWSKGPNGGGSGDGVESAPDKPVQIAGDVIHMGTLVATSIARVAGEFPSTTCHYESTFGDFSRSFRGVGDCPRMWQIPFDMLP